MIVEDRELGVGSREDRESGVNPPDLASHEYWVIKILDV
jgi:hypothetical protein